MSTSIPMSRALCDAMESMSLSGYRVPSRANQAAFERAVAEIAASTCALLDALVTR
jgi:hypothetical protein